LDELETSPFYKVPGFIIGLTQFEELTGEYSQYFSDRLFHLLKYELSSIEWRNQLKKIIFHLVKQAEQIINPDKFNYLYDGAFICALYDPEFMAIKDLTTKWEKKIHSEDTNI